MFEQVDHPLCKFGRTVAAMFPVRGYDALDIKFIAVVLDREVLSFGIGDVVVNSNDNGNAELPDIANVTPEIRASFDDSVGIFFVKFALGHPTRAS